MEQFFNDCTIFPEKSTSSCMFSGMVSRDIACAGRDNLLVLLMHLYIPANRYVRSGTASVSGSRYAVVHGYTSVVEVSG
ncbi:MAG: hypothetical protein KKH22_02925 [Proteobacteria bacterium]|nr:hypothetical protein [Pseudomonadota bacterium]